MAKIKGKLSFFVVLVLIAGLAYVALFGISSTFGDLTKTYVKGAGNIRWGIDIRGGVEVTFGPPADYDATEVEMRAATAVINQRLIKMNITDSEVYTDYDTDRIIVRFPWKEDEKDYDPEAAIAELGETAMLSLREEVDPPEGVIMVDGQPYLETVLTGDDVLEATAVYYPNESGVTQFAVKLELKESGRVKFAEATARNIGKPIYILMDETVVSAPTVQSTITDGTAMIESSQFTAQTAQELADKINAGALPFKLETKGFNSISPTLGMGAKDAMVLAGAIALLVVCLFVILRYRLPGLIASFSLIGIVASAILAVSMPGFTLTIPGIAGIILTIGIGVDANIISAERVKEELRGGRPLDKAVDQGLKRAFTAILDGNITIIIVAIILMGAFGPPGSLLSKIFTPVFFMFGASMSGTIYSFGYTLLVGVIVNMIFGVWLSRVMLKSASKFKIFRNPWLCGGDK